MALNQEEKWLLDEKYEGTENEAFYADLERLKKGEPLAYLIGHTPFIGCRIYLDSRPLIPRVETEYWVQNAIEEMKKVEHPLKVLDLCAGSGCIGVAVAKTLPNSSVDFVEMDTSHHQTIEKNLKANNIENANIFGGDLFENVTDVYDFILSNPPYIDPALDRTEASVKDHEPVLALYGGQGGMEIIQRIITGCADHLIPGGQLWIEHEPEQASEIERLAKEAGFTSLPGHDQYGTVRYTKLVR